ncbi:MAG: CxxC-x17-CxxC domain-containing protein [Patescibacteria group bacterium]
MGNFKRSGDGGKFKRDRGFSNKGGGFRDRDERPEMHKAICSECGRDCEVPFRPTGDKPVYCSDCFKNKSRDDSRRPSFGEKKMFPAICDKCGQHCEVPFRPTGDKPVYCSQCFGKGDNAGPKAKAPEQSNRQMEIIISKLDKILNLLAPNTPKEMPKKAETPKKTEAPKVKKEVKVKPKAKTVPKKIKAKKKK